MLALHSGLIDQDTLVAAFEVGARAQGVALADHLQARATSRPATAAPSRRSSRGLAA
jgi:hypothetical protein